MLLASATEIREQFGFDDMTDVSFAITAALDAAEPRLASMLASDFTRETVTETFFAREPGWKSGVRCTEFRLKHGFVQSLTSVAAALAADQFGNPSSQTDLSSSVQLNGEKGVVTDLGTRYSNQFVRITYVKGFDAQDTESYDLTQVPKWLQQAAKLTAIIDLAVSPSFTEAQIKIDTALLGKQLAALMDRHLRYTPLALLAL